MTDLDRRLRSLDLIDPPDLWREAELRARSTALAPPEPRRRPVLVAAGAAALALVVIGGAALLVRQGREAPQPVPPVASSTTAATTTSVVPSTTAAPTTTMVPSTTVAPPTTEAATTTTTTPPLPQGPIAWSPIPLGVEGNVRTVVEGGDGLLAFGDADGESAMWTSADGTAWDRVQSDGPLFEVEGTYFEVAGIAAGADGYVAVGGDRGIAGSGYREVAVWWSGDGLAWERVPLGEEFAMDEGTLVQINSVAYGPAGFVAVGWTTDQDTPWLLGDHLVIASGDGRSWRIADTGDLPLGGMQNLTAGGPGYVAVGIDWRTSIGHPGVWLSSDGLTWTQPDPEGIESVVVDEMGISMDTVTAASDGRLFAAGMGFAVWESQDGVAWTLISTGPEEYPDMAFGADPTGLAAAGDEIVAVGRWVYPGDAGRGGAWISGDRGTTWEPAVAQSGVFGDDIDLSTVVGLDGAYLAAGSADGEATLWSGIWEE